MAKSWINQDNMLQMLKAHLDAEMRAAAEPVIRKAVEEAEKEMRKRLAVTLVGLLEQNFSMERMGPDLRITVRTEVPNAK